MAKVIRGVGNRQAVDFRELNLPILKESAISILGSIGFRIVEIDLLTEARKLIGKSQYRRSARPSEAPQVVDCSGLTKWLYGQIGIWLPRRSIQQREMGHPIDISECQPGDLVFCSGWIDYYLNDPADGVGHVGIISNNKSVIHAANRQFGVIESPLARFTEETPFRGACRIVDLNEIVAFETPKEREVETSDDIKWIVLQNTT